MKAMDLALDLLAEASVLESAYENSAGGGPVEAVRLIKLAAGALMRQENALERIAALDAGAVSTAPEIAKAALDGPDEAES